MSSTAFFKSKRDNRSEGNTFLFIIRSCFFFFFSPRFLSPLPESALMYNLNLALVGGR